MNTAVFWTSVLFIGILSGIYAGLGVAVSPAPYMLTGLVTQLAIAMWLGSEIRRRGYHAAFDAQTFIFFAWPVAGPYYIFRTRGWRGFYILIAAPAVWFAGLYAGVFAGMAL